MLISIVAGLLLSECLLRLKGLIKVKKFEGFKDSESDALYFLFVGLIIFVLWIPVFLAFYPGFFAYDVMAQIAQVKTGEYSTHHPLLHTLGLGFFYETIGGKLLKDYTKGIALASIFQMLTFSFQLSYIHLFLKRAKTSKLMRGILIAFCGICPFFSMLAISMTKDTVFAGFLGMLLASVAYFEMDYDYSVKSKSVKIPFMLSFVGTALFRSNGRIAVWVLTVLLLIKYISQKKKHIVILGIISVLISEALFCGIKLTLKASAPSQTEMLSIPLQQMAFVYELNYDTLSLEDKNTIEMLIPEVINYNRIISDPIKFTADYLDNKDIFWKTYLKLFAGHPRQYVEAFLENNLGFLCILDKTNATVYGTGYERRRGFLMAYTRDGYGVEAKSRLKPLEDLYLKLYCENDYQKNLLTFLPCSMGLYFWLIVLSVFLMIDKKAKRAASVLFILALGATTLLGPCAIIRYMLPYVVCLPVLWTEALK
ncbi:MAG: DUF6020 family protein [Lachnospiraceae bacterium]|nr:DUF6020 family protein [Lachnospiraceae bacterium]